MTAVGSMTFALLLWGGIVGVSLVFVYEVYAIAGEYGWLA